MNMWIVWGMVVVVLISIGLVIWDMSKTYDSLYKIDFLMVTVEVLQKTCYVSMIILGIVGIVQLIFFSDSPMDKEGQSNVEQVKDEISDEVVNAMEEINQVVLKKGVYADIGIDKEDDNKLNVVYRKSANIDLGEQGWDNVFKSKFVANRKRYEKEDYTKQLGEHYVRTVELGTTGNHKVEYQIYLDGIDNPVKLVQNTENFETLKKLPEELVRWENVLETASSYVQVDKILNEGLSEKTKKRLKRKIISEETAKRLGIDVAEDKQLYEDDNSRQTVWQRRIESDDADDKYRNVTYYGVIRGILDKWYTDNIKEYSKCIVVSGWSPKEVSEDSDSLIEFGEDDSKEILNFFVDSK